MTSLNDFPFDKSNTKSSRKHIPVLKKDIRSNPTEGVILKELSNSSFTQHLIPKIYFVDSNFVWMENIQFTLGEFLLGLEKSRQKMLFQFVVVKLIEIFFVLKDFGIIHGDLCNPGSILRNIVVEPIAKKFYLVDFDCCFRIQDTPDYENVFVDVLGELRELLDVEPTVSKYNCRGSLNKISFCDLEGIGN